MFEESRERRVSGHAGRGSVVTAKPAPTGEGLLFLRGRFPFDSLMKLFSCVGSLLVVRLERAEDFPDDCACHS